MPWREADSIFASVRVRGSRRVGLLSIGRFPLCHPEPVTSPLCASPGRLENARNRAYFIELLRGWKDFNIHKAVDGSRHMLNKTLGKR